MGIDFRIARSCSSTFCLRRPLSNPCCILFKLLFSETIIFALLFRTGASFLPTVSNIRQETWPFGLQAATSTIPMRPFAFNHRHRAAKQTLNQPRFVFYCTKRRREKNGIRKRNIGLGCEKWLKEKVESIFFSLYFHRVLLLLLSLLWTLYTTQLWNWAGTTGWLGLPVTSVFLSSQTYFSLSTPLTHTSAETRNPYGEQ